MGLVVGLAHAPYRFKFCRKSFLRMFGKKLYGGTSSRWAKIDMFKPIEKIGINFKLSQTALEQVFVERV